MIFYLIKKEKKSLNYILNIKDDIITILSNNIEYIHFGYIFLAKKL